MGEGAVIQQNKLNKKEKTWLLLRGRVALIVKHIFLHHPCHNATRSMTDARWSIPERSRTPCPLHRDEINKSITFRGACSGVVRLKVSHIFSSATHATPPQVLRQFSQGSSPASSRKNDPSNNTS
jgi:hypothetical protein